MKAKEAVEKIKAIIREQSDKKSQLEKSDVFFSDEDAERYMIAGYKEICKVVNDTMD